MASPPSTPPSTLSLIIGASIVAGVTGFFLGQASSIGLLGGAPGRRKRRQPVTNAGKADLTDRKVADEEDSESGESEDELQEGLEAFEKEGGECKLTLVVRTDLEMTKGKIAAQCSHATLACYKSLQSSPAGQSILKRWERLGQAKVALKVRSQEELEVLQAQAVSLGVCARIVLDAGRTQIEAGSATVLGVGPAPKGVVDRITGGLKLL